MKIIEITVLFRLCVKIYVGLTRAVKTTGIAGGLIRPYKGLIPTSATRALKDLAIAPLLPAVPSLSGGSFTPDRCYSYFSICLLFPVHP